MMVPDMVRGMVAGACGTVALDAVTYADMVLRGRPSSPVPAKVAGELAGRAGVRLADDADTNQDKVQNRESGLGALMGYATGVGVGAVYGLIRPHLSGVPRPLAAVVVGLAAMAASDAPATALGVTNPQAWDIASWTADIIPHVTYGLATVLAFDSLAQ